jgi:hypothetical protein
MSTAARTVRGFAAVSTVVHRTCLCGQHTLCRLTIRCNGRRQYTTGRSRQRYSLHTSTNRPAKMNGYALRGHFGVVSCLLYACTRPLRWPKCPISPGPEGRCTCPHVVWCVTAGVSAQCEEQASHPRSVRMNGRIGKSKFRGGCQQPNLVTCLLYTIDGSKAW